jgi:uncharacterized protein (TIGR03067 family)
MRGGTMIRAKLLLGILVILLSWAAIGTAGDTDPVKKELKALEGFWVPKSAVDGTGKPMDLKIFGRYEIRTGGKVTILTTRKDVKYDAEVILDLEKAPKRITFRHKPDVYWEFSYELKGDMLTLVEAKRGKFPNSLTDEGFFKFVYTRAK